MITSIVKKLIPRRLRHEHRFGNGYLAAKGWHPTADVRQSFDQGGPIPWITYPALMMLERVVKPHHRVFEYGCGNSSLWWAKRVAEIVAVEQHDDWAKQIAAEAPENLKIVHHRINEPADTAAIEPFFSDGRKEPRLWDDDATLWHGLLNREFAAYAMEITRYPKGQFDIVIVDGMARSLTAWLAAEYVNPKGFVLFDNSNRPQYNEGYRALCDAGFKRLDFYGPSPVNYVENCTSIFAKNFDWLSPNTILPEDQICDLTRA